MKICKSLLMHVILGLGLICFLSGSLSAQSCNFTHYTLSPTTTPGSNGQFCGNVTLVMSGSQNSSYKYQMNIGGTNYGTAKTGNTGQITFDPIDPTHGGTVLIYATLLNSQCPATVVAGTQVFFYPNPAGGTVTASNNTNQVCSTKPMTFTANPPGTGFNFQWFLNGTAISGAISSTYTTTVGGTFSVQVSNSCYAPVTYTYPNTVTTLPDVGAIGNITPGAQQYTQGSAPTTFTATASGAASYQWTLSQPNAGSILGTTNSATMTWNPSFVGEVTISATAIGCGSPSMKSLTITILPASSAAYTSQVENFINYIKESDVRTTGITTAAAVDALAVGQRNVTYTYLDGLGVPTQRVLQMASSNNNKDVIWQLERDEYNREEKRYDPYTATTTDGSYHPYAIAEQLAFYNPSAPGAPNIAATPFPYGETNFEPSPINRIAELGAQGDVWQLTGKPSATAPGHTVKHDFTTNDNSTFNPANNLGTKNVILYTATITATNNIRTLSGTTSTVYAPGTLFVNITKDENWTSANGVQGTVEEYKDNRGRVLLKRLYNQNGANTDILSTYYVYDDFGDLAFVLPPAANPDNGSITQATLDNQCYQYRYDQKNRLVQRKIPGKGWEFLVYNNLDRVAAMQDANQRNMTPQQWTFTKYDAMGRVAMTGIYVYTGSTADANLSSPSLTYLNTLQNTYTTTATPLWESRNNSTTTGYANTSLPTSASTYYSINYYNDYTAPSGTIPAAFTYASASKMTRGLLTASFINVLSTANMLCSVTFYDDLGRDWVDFDQHYLGGTLNAANYDEIINTYNFDNSFSTVQRTHYTSAGGSSPVVTVLNTYTYDIIGRQKQIKKRINATTDLILLQNDYNEVGQLVTKHLHSTNGGTSYLQNTSYSYNERGWTSKINDPTSVSATQVFGEQVYYGDNPTTTLRTYNGNVSSQKWQTLIPTGSGITQQWQNFDYTYDNINRLLTAHYTSQTAADAGAYDEVLTYDKGGNITFLNRWGKPSTTVKQIDQLTYTYANSGASNQLSSVNDATSYSQGQASGLASYTYDNNGNLLTDSKKSITIAYNLLNLPQSVTQTGNSSTLGFVYTADGKKLRKTYGTVTRDYDNGIEYNNGAIEFVTTEEGRATPGTSYAYEYLIKDHLGNTRATIKQDGKVYQFQDYYAYGMDIPVAAATTPDNRYKYAKKEYETETSLAQYDFSARFYDPAIARFTTIDPLAELMRRHSPYNYAMDNPMRFTDPTGMAAGDTTKTDTIKNGGTLKEVTITATSTKKKSWWGNVINIASQTADFIPFVGSIKQIATGIYHGDWKETTMGVVGLGLDALTGGEGGEALRIAEVAGEDLIKVAAKDEVEEVAEKSLTEATELHHSDPMFMEGDANQDLTKMSKGEHRELHKDMNKHLEGYKNGDGKSMAPKRGNSGAQIRQNFPRSERLKALKDFYKGPGAKYTNAAKDFFKQHPNL